MPRIARIVIPGIPHHIVQRGNNRQDVFFLDDDRRFYLSVLKVQAQQHGLEMLGWCLMTNHVHLVAIPKTEDSLHQAIGLTHLLYTQYVNRLHGRSGHLWQNRFYSCALDEAHLLAALAYVERNPVRAKLVKRAWLYPWSSAKAHVEEVDQVGLLEAERWKEFLAGIDWLSFLIRPEDEKQVAGLRSHTCRGRPLGSDAFLSKIEKRLGRRMRPLPEGWPKGKRRKPG
jgi:putative transposase